MDNQHYRYCFSCEKWKTKSEINEIDLGPQPGGGNGKSYNCNTCRKDLGDQIHLFKCHTHPEEILKVWGTLEGQNQEKIFFPKCPQENQEQDNGMSNGKLTLIAGGCLLIAGVIVGLGYIFWKKRKT